MKLKRIFINSIEEWSLKKPLSILGPTGSGKTSTLLNFLRSSGQRPLLVSLDSVAAYKELDIGSSKPLGSDFNDFDWSGISFVSPIVKMNVSLMRDEIDPKISEANLLNKSIVFIGGTHFYERFILEGAAPGEASCPQFQSSLKEKGSRQIWSDLIKIDQRWERDLHPNDEYRVFRYADLVFRQGLSYDQLKTGSSSPRFNEVECLILNPNREDLEPKLKLRIDEMLKSGWIEETKSLMHKYGPECPALKSVGYAEIVGSLLGSASLNQQELSEQILIRHRQLAKQQRTWIRKLSEQC